MSEVLGLIALVLSSFICGVVFTLYFAMKIADSGWR